MPHRSPSVRSRLHWALGPALLLATAWARAQEWSAPVVLATGPASHLDDMNSPQLVLSRTGAALAIFHVMNEQGEAQLHAAARLPGPGSTRCRWQPAVQLSRQEMMGPASVAISDSGTGMVAWREGDQAVVATCAAGTWGAPVSLGKADWDPQVAMDAAGVALVYWVTSDRAVVASRYEPGSGWGEPVQLHVRPGEGVDLQMATDGRARMVISRDEKICSLAYEPGMGWGEPTPFHYAGDAATGPGFPRDSYTRAFALGPGGQGVALLVDRFAYEDPDAMPNSTGYDVLAYDFRTRSTTRLDTVRPPRDELWSPMDLRVALDDSGRALCSWIVDTPRVARFDQGRWGAPAALGVAGGVPEVDDFDLAVAPGGAALAVYIQAQAAAPEQAILWSQAFRPEDADRFLGPGWQPALRIGVEPSAAQRPVLAMNDALAVVLFLWIRDGVRYTVVERQAQGGS